MSTVIDPAGADTPPTPGLSREPARSRPRAAALVWASVACVMLGASGVVRTVQERRHQFEKSQKEVCPIDLAKIPQQIGREWKMIKNGERQLDPLTMRITGGTDHLIRTYANDLTGVFVTVLVLFGPAEPVLPHTPQACYPATGFSVGDAPASRTITYVAGRDERNQPIEGNAEFLSASYFKPNGRQTLRDAVYHSFRLDGQWSPNIGQGRKFPEAQPGIFKIQIQRMEAEGEKLEKGDPLEQFLKLFLSEIEAEIRAASKQEAAPPVGGGAPKSVAGK